MPCILFGFLTFKPKSLVGSAATGSLFVEDNLGALACEVGIHSTLKVLCTEVKCVVLKSFSVVIRALCSWSLSHYTPTLKLQLVYFCFQIINPDKQHVDSLVLIPEWNYVPSKFSMSRKQPRNDNNCVGKLFCHNCTV